MKNAVKKTAANSIGSIYICNAIHHKTLSGFKSFLKFSNELKKSLNHTLSGVKASRFVVPFHSFIRLMDCDV